MLTMKRGDLPRTPWQPVAVIAAAALAAAAGAEDFPRFVVPGFEQDMQSLEQLHAVHHEAAFSDCTLWDAWLPHATLWVSERKRSQYRESFLSRRIDAEGYVSMHQHRGMAHSEG